MSYPTTIGCASASCNVLTLDVQVVAAAAEQKFVLNACANNDQMKAALPHLLEQLELCQKSLSAYLESKRSEFPRFYFVSDSTLLEILSLGSDPRSVMTQFQSGLFDSLASLQFDTDQKDKVSSLVSVQGETVSLSVPFETKGMASICRYSRILDWQQREAGIY